VAAADGRDDRGRRRGGSNADAAADPGGTSAPPSLIPPAPALPDPDGDLPTSPDEGIYVAAAVPTDGGGDDDGDGALTPDAVADQAVELVEEVTTPPGA